MMQYNMLVYNVLAREKSRVGHPMMTRTEDDHIMNLISPKKYIDYRKLKRIYTHATGEGVKISVRCIYNINTGHIGISSVFAKQNGWNGGAAANKTCSTYLGVAVAERVLSKVFKNVYRMPYGNSGYDFVCGRGYRIDVKAACKKTNIGQDGVLTYIKTQLLIISCL